MKLIIIILICFQFNCKEEKSGNEERLPHPINKNNEKSISKNTNFEFKSNEKKQKDSTKSYYTVVNVKQGLVIREEPSKDSNSVGLLEEYDEVEWIEDSPSEETIYGLTNYWKKVKIDKDGVTKEGWSFGAFLEPDGDKNYSPDETFFYIVKGNCSGSIYTREEGCQINIYRKKDFNLLKSLNDSSGMIEGWLSNTIVHFRSSLGDGGCDGFEEKILDLSEPSLEVKDFYQKNSCAGLESNPFNPDDYSYFTKTEGGSCSILFNKKRELVEISCFNIDKKLKSTSLSVTFPEVELNLKPMEIDLDSGTYSINIKNGNFKKIN